MKKQNAAVAKAGLVAVPINFRLTGPEAEYIIEDCGVAAVLVEDSLTEVVESVRERLSLPEDRFVLMGGDPSPAAGYLAYEALVRDASETEPGQPVGVGPGVGEPLLADRQEHVADVLLEEGPLLIVEGGKPPGQRRCLVEGLLLLAPLGGQPAARGQLLQVPVSTSIRCSE